MLIEVVESTIPTLKDKLNDCFASRLMFAARELNERLYNELLIPSSIISPLEKSAND